MSGSREASRRSSVMSWNWPTQHSGRPCSSRRKVRLASVQTTSPSGRTKRFSHCQAVQLAAQDAPGGVEVALAVVGMGELLVAHAEQLVGGAAEQRAQRRVDAHVLAVGVEQRHPDRHRVEGGVERAGRAAVELAQDAQQPAASSTRTLTSSANGTPLARRPSSGTSRDVRSRASPSTAAHSRAGSGTSSRAREPTGSARNISAASGLAASTSPPGVEHDGRLREQRERQRR